MRGMVLIVLLLLAFQTAFCSTYAQPATEPISKTITVQTYYPEVYKKKKPKPLRRKMVLVTPVHFENDDSTESKANSSEENAPFQSGDRLLAIYGFFSASHTQSLRWAERQAGWKSYISPPDSPPPQGTL